MAADAATPDVGGTSLTDGIHAPAALGPGWQARDNVWVYSFVVDLGAPRAITEINTNWLQVKNQWVFLPPSVTYSTSLDGTNFDTVAYIPRPAMSDADQTRALRAIGLNVTARYVRVSLDGTDQTLHYRIGAT